MFQCGHNICMEVFKDAGAGVYSGKRCQKVILDRLLRKARQVNI